MLRRYAGLTQRLLRHDDPPDLVVWPENAIQTPVDDPFYGRPVRRLAARVPLLLGAPRSERDIDSATRTLSPGRMSFSITWS